MKRIQKRAFIYWICCLGISFPACAQKHLDLPVFVDPAFSYDHWSVENGLPVNSVNEIIQSREGYIWLGTNDGLARFDGIRFKVYKSAEYDGLPSNRIVNIIEARDSTLWLKTDRQELVQFKNGVFTHLTKADGLNGDQVHSFSTDSREQLWIGASEGISVYKNGVLEPYHPDIIMEHVSQIYVDQQHILWFKDNEDLHLYRFDGRTKTYLATTEGSTDPTPFLTLNDGSTIFPTQGHLYIYKDGTVTELVKGLPEDFQITDFTQDSTGMVIVASLERGIYSYYNGNWTPINSDYKGRKRGAFLFTGQHLWAAGNRRVLFDNQFVFSFTNQITHYLYDKEGSFWFGTVSAGLFRLKPNVFKIYSEEEGVPSRNIYPVYEASDGSIWFGTHGEGPVQLANQALTSSYVFSPPPDNQFVRSIVQRQNGDLLISLLGDGIYKYNPKREVFEGWATPEKHEFISRNLTIGSLFEDGKGYLWAGSNHGLFVMRESLWERIPDSEVNPNHEVRFILEGPDTSLWMATNGGGILHYRDGFFKSYNTGHGLSSNLIRALHIDTTASSEGYVLWVGTEDKGINRIIIHKSEPDFSTLISFDEQDGLYDNAVHNIILDNDNRFWMSGNKGLSWVSRDQLDQFTNGEISEIMSTAYTEQDGLRNREANGGIQPAGIKSRDGKLWFPTQDGLAMVDPDNIARNELPPPVIIEEVRSDGTLISKKENVFTLEPEQRNFEVAYTGLSFMVPEKVRFRYRLKNFKDSWTEAGPRRTAFFTNVPAGSYEFQVMATNNEGIWTQNYVSQAVIVQPFLYEKNIFYLIMTALIGAIIILGIQFRTRNLKKREKELEQSVSIRTFELEAEKKKTELQAKELLMLDKAKSQFFANITHEFRTPLTLIIGPLLRIIKTDREIPREEINYEIERVLRSSHRLQRLIEQILDVSRLEAGELKLNIQSTDLVGFTQNMLNLFQPLAEEQNQILGLHTDLNKSLVYLDSDAFEKILANLVSNAIKFTPNGGKIWVELAESDIECIVKVRDSGIGIPKEKATHIFDRFYQADDSSTRVAEGSGIGLALVKNLVELHKGSIEVHSEVGTGSVFTIRFKKGTEHFTDKIILTPQDSTLPNIDTRKYTGFVPQHEALTTTEKEDTPTVLVVEDNTDMRDFISSVLKESFSVIQAQDGKVALELIKETLPDLIVADIMMPNMDGMELNEALKKDPMLESIPIIFLTAKTASDSKLKGFEDGVDDYLTKPFDSEILVARIDNIIRKRKKLREYYLESRTETESEDITDPFLKKVVTTIEEHFANPDFGVLELSELIHMDRTRLYRKIKELTNKSPQVFLSDFRMKKAAKMIEERQGNLSEIAYASGFNSLAYFSRVFKKHYKTSPSEYMINTFHS